MATAIAVAVAIATVPLTPQRRRLPRQRLPHCLDVNFTVLNFIEDTKERSLGVFVVLVQSSQLLSFL